MENKRKGGAEKIREKKMKLLKKSSENCVKINQCFTPIVTSLCYSDSGKYKFDFKARHCITNNFNNWYIILVIPENLSNQPLLGIGNVSIYLLILPMIIIFTKNSLKIICI